MEKGLTGAHVADTSWGMLCASCLLPSGPEASTHRGSSSLLPLLGSRQPITSPTLQRARDPHPVKIRVWISHWLEELAHLHAGNLRRLVFCLFWKLKHVDKATPDSGTARQLGIPRATENHTHNTGGGGQGEGKPILSQRKIALSPAAKAHM